ncbi:MAG: PilZ domain-containing protein [Pyrinomonadaceae bacterium]|nr:PilZ domain-containing protein [Pyrinomonadaceae bacterium]
MSISERKHIRLTLDIPAVRHTKEGERLAFVLYQISIGGCLIEWDEGIEEQEEFRMEIQLPDGNWLPLSCKALYRFQDDGIGVQFLDITPFEQELIVKIMSSNLEQEGIPLEVDPFDKPKTFFSAEMRKSDMGLDNDS